MSRCPSCGELVEFEATSCKGCGASFRTPLPNVPSLPSEPTFPFTERETRLARWLAIGIFCMTVAAAVVLIRNLLTGTNSSELRQLAAGAPLLGLNLWAAYGLTRVAVAQEASLGPYLSFTKQQSPSARRGLMLLVCAMTIFFSALVVPR